MGVQCSCDYREEPSARNTEVKLQTMTLQSINQSFLASPVASEAEKSIPSPITCSSPILKLPALSYLSQFYTRISHRVTDRAFNLQIALEIPWINGEDIFDFPVEGEDDSIYFGQWEKTRKHGKGIQINGDKSIYTGHFYKGRHKGQGRIIYSSGEHYEGQFCHNLPHGKGVMNLKKKSILGTFENGIAEGFCTIQWKHAIYTGDMKSGKRSGHGKLQQQGKTYEGDFIDDIIVGHGCCCWDNGKKYEGQWQNNNMHGYGIFSWQDGKIYEGEYKDGMKDGIGKMTWTDGRSYNGEWTKGYQHGLAEYSYFCKTKQEFIVKKGMWYQGKRSEWIS